MKRLAFATCVLPPIALGDNGVSANDKGAQKKQENALKWKERILKVPVGSYVKVKTDNHAEYEGQLRDITDATSSVQVVNHGQIEMIAVPYSDVKSINVNGRSSTGSKVAKNLMWQVL